MPVASSLTGAHADTLDLASFTQQPVTDRQADAYNLNNIMISKATHRGVVSYTIYTT